MPFSLRCLVMFFFQADQIHFPIVQCSHPPIHSSSIQIPMADPMTKMLSDRCGNKSVAEGEPSRYLTLPVLPYLNYSDDASRSNQERQGGNGYSAPSMHSQGRPNVETTRTTADKSGSVQHQWREQQPGSSVDRSGQKIYRCPQNPSRQYSAAQTELLRGIGDHLGPSPSNIRASGTRHPMDLGISHAALTSTLRSGNEGRQARPMERFLQEEPSDQPALFIDPATGRLSYGGGYLRRHGGHHD